MTDKLDIHAFGKSDRSGKVRWLAHELGLEIEEHAVKLGDNRQFPYRDINPYAAIPSVQWQGKTLIESTAISTYLAEQFPEHKLVVVADEPERFDYLKWMSVFAETLEMKLVEYYLAGVGLMPKEVRDLHQKGLAFKLRIALQQLPKQGFLVANRFTLADITAAYSLRLAISAGLVEFDSVSDYLTPLMQRDAAIKAEFFKSLKR